LLEPHLRSLTWPGTWRMARRWWRTGIAELRFAAKRGAYVREAQRFLPDLRPDDVEPAFTGTRAQALARDGTLLDDFAFTSQGNVLHVRNAPSPAATSSLAIARYVVDEALR
jgi:2-hydroxyglutarate dehydrogenase